MGNAGGIICGIGNIGVIRNIGVIGQWIGKREDVKDQYNIGDKIRERIRKIRMVEDPDLLAIYAA